MESVIDIRKEENVIQQLESVLNEILYAEQNNAARAALCKNCHDEYHRYLGFSYLRKKNTQPKEFYISKWAKWISGFTFLLSIGYIFLYLNK